MTQKRWFVRGMSALLISGQGLLLGGCSGSNSDGSAAPIFDEIGVSEMVYAAGNEPFWSIEAAGSELSYKTPETPNGSVISVERFSGNSGLGLSGNFEGEEMYLMITRGTCDDTMADRSYPYTATLKLGEAVLTGCAWTESQPYRETETGGGA